MIGHRHLTLLAALASLGVIPRREDEIKVAVDELREGEVGVVEGVTIHESPKVRVDMGVSTPTRFTPKQTLVRVSPDSRAGKRMTGAFMGNHHHSKPHQGAKEIARRRKQMERSRA